VIRTPLVLIALLLGGAVITRTQTAIKTTDPRRLEGQPAPRIEVQVRLGPPACQALTNRKARSSSSSGRTGARTAT
jgi:hypothetical protein